MLDSVPTELLFLVSLGLGLLLVILRFDAERFGAAEYDALVDGVRPPLPAAGLVPGRDRADPGDHVHRS